MANCPRAHVTAGDTAVLQDGSLGIHFGPRIAKPVLLTPLLICQAPCVLPSLSTQISSYERDVVTMNEIVFAKYSEIPGKTIRLIQHITMTKATDSPASSRDHTDNFPLT